MMKTVELPWKEPRTPRDSAEPPSELFIGKVEFRIFEASEDNPCPHTGRKKFKILCKTCGHSGRGVVHPSTATPETWIVGHLREEHGVEVRLVHKGAR